MSNVSHSSSIATLTLRVPAALDLAPRVSLLRYFVTWAFQGNGELLDLLALRRDVIVSVVDAASLDPDGRAAAHARDGAQSAFPRPAAGQPAPAGAAADGTGTRDALEIAIAYGPSFRTPDHLVVEGICTHFTANLLIASLSSNGVDDLQDALPHVVTLASRVSQEFDCERNAFSDPDLLDSMRKGRRARAIESVIRPPVETRFAVPIRRQSHA